MARMFLAALALFLGAFAAQAQEGQHPPGMAPGNPGMGQGMQTQGPPLTAERVEGFIASMRELRARFGPDGRAATQRDYAEVQAILSRHGFDDMGQWTHTLRQVSLGYAAARTSPSERAEAQREMEQQRQRILSSDMPEARKQQMLQAMESVQGMLAAEDEARVVAPYLDELEQVMDE